MAESAEHDTSEFVSADQRAERFFGPSPERVRVEFGALSHPGKVRTRNEDHYAVVRRHRSRTVLSTNMPAETLPQTEEDAYVMAVADGIGGAAFGDLASMLALRTGWDLAERETSWALNVNDAEAETLPDKFDAYVQLIHRRLVRQAEVDPQTAGMGTTLTAAYTVGSEAFVAHIGDSRAYLYRDEAIHRLTRDHTVAEELVAAGMSPGDASKFGNLLTNSLGGKGGKVVTDVHHFQLCDGDTLLLSTDGLTDLVEDEEISQVLASRDDPQDACQALLDLALDRGGKDNVTIIVARYAISAGA
jgi:protein phosphatase